MNGFLLDTNVPSELTNPMPDPLVSVAELRRGFTLLSKGKQRTRLEQWFELYLLPLFEDRILPVTQSIGDRWGVLDAECQLRGKALNTADGLIAATAVEHTLTLGTRNVKDFHGLGLGILNPWDAI